ncbi:hypothetical protein RCL1_005810 [Eukaryota sp. TZLM3-RCL]
MTASLKDRLNNDFVVLLFLDKETPLSSSSLSCFLEFQEKDALFKRHSEYLYIDEHMQWVVKLGLHASPSILIFLHGSRVMFRDGSDLPQLFYSGPVTDDVLATISRMIPYIKSNICDQHCILID